MELEEISILTKFISAWFWHLTAMLFLVGIFIMAALPQNTVTLLSSIVFLAVFLFTETMAFRRKNDIYKK